jgi:3-oxoadipate enol-lactonase
MPYVENAGTQVYWTEAGSGPPVLLIMGLSFTHEMWYRTLPVLGGFRAILFDNRGMGRSSVPRGPYSIREMAADARAVLDAAGVQRADIIGASMGGMIAQELALQYPESVGRLILACTSYSGFFSRWPDVRFAGWILGSRTVRDGRRRSLTDLLYADTTPQERIEEDLRIRAACTWTAAGFYSQLAAILTWNAYYRLPRITAPTLVLHGDQDRLIPVQNGRTIARRIPGAIFEEIPDAGHILMTDQPEACGEAVARFLHGQTSSDEVDWGFMMGR